MLNIMRIDFTKMHGLGNDFLLYVRDSGQPLPTVTQWRQLADRHRGVGFDQAVVFEPPHDPAAAAAYRIFNADGGEAEQSGNGARCAIRLLHLQGRTTAGQVTIQTGAGLIRGRVHDDGRVSVDMGAPNFDPAALPFLADALEATYALPVGAETVEFGAVSMGNPHAVLRIAAVESAPVERIGRALQSDRHFPKAVNVGFMQVIDASQIRLRVYERGAGETQACGTGACAAVAVGRNLGLLAAEVTVHVPGGQLSVHWEGPGHSVWLTGPAVVAYTGQVEI
jgi:diaminopimelate epimerase